MSQIGYKGYMGSRFLVHGFLIDHKPGEGGVKNGDGKSWERKGKTATSEWLPTKLEDENDDEDEAPFLGGLDR